MDSRWLDHLPRSHRPTDLNPMANVDKLLLFFGPGDPWATLVPLLALSCDDCIPFCAPHSMEMAMDDYDRVNFFPDVRCRQRCHWHCASIRLACHLKIADLQGPSK